MAILYKLVENKVPGSKACGKWYARYPIGRKDNRRHCRHHATELFAKTQRHLAALIELSDTLESLLLDGYRVDIPRLGSFKVGLKSEGVDDPSNFNERKHLKKPIIHFKPSKVYKRELRKHVIRALEDATYVDASKLASGKEMEERRKEK